MVSKMTITEAMPSHLLSPSSALRRRKSQRALLKAKRVSFVHQEMGASAAADDDDDSPHHFSRTEFVKAILSQAKAINFDLEGEYNFDDDDERSIDSLGDLLVAEPRGPPGFDDSMPCLLSFCQSSTVSLLSMQSLSCLGHDDSSGAIQMIDFMEEDSVVTDVDHVEGSLVVRGESLRPLAAGPEECHP
jgi:hypothetical protein